MLRKEVMQIINLLYFKSPSSAQLNIETSVNLYSSLFVKTTLKKTEEKDK
jgi:hypothetical protein